MTSIDDILPALVDPNDPGGVIDLSIYSRTPRPLQHTPCKANEIFIRSQRSSIALQKRLKKLFFDDQHEAVVIHSAGKNIFDAVKAATDFCDHHAPWFQTHVVTSTEVVYDDYEPIVSGISAQHNIPTDSDDKSGDNNGNTIVTPTSTPTLATATGTATSTGTSTGKRKKPIDPVDGSYHTTQSPSQLQSQSQPDQHGDNNQQRKTKKLKTTKPSSHHQSNNHSTDHHPSDDNLVTLHDQTPPSSADSQRSPHDANQNNNNNDNNSHLPHQSTPGNPIVPFFRCRLISAIHITITKTTIGQEYVK